MNLRSSTSPSMIVLVIAFEMMGSAHERGRLTKGEIKYGSAPGDRQRAKVKVLNRKGRPVAEKDGTLTIEIIEKEEASG